MISEYSVKINELLRMSKEAIKRYCRQEGLSNIQVEYGILDKSKEFAGFVYNTIPVKIVLNTNACDRLNNMQPIKRVWWLNNYIVHELTHYKQYLFMRKNNIPISEKKFNEYEANLTGNIYADRVIKNYTVEQINPVKNPSSLYESFHGNPPKELRKVKLHVPKPGEHLIAIGKLARIDYRPFGSSKRKNTEYYHMSGDTGETILPTNLILCCDQSGKNFYLVKEDDTKDNPKFTDRGIIGVFIISVLLGFWRILG